MAAVCLQSHAGRVDVLKCVRAAPLLWRKSSPKRLQLVNRGRRRA
jgi:hypothetical protein